MQFSEAATSRCSLKNLALKSNVKLLEKYLQRSSLSSKVAGYRPKTELLLRYFTRIVTTNTSDNFTMLLCLRRAILTEHLHWLLVKFQWLLHILEPNKGIISLIQININLWKQIQNWEIFFILVEIGTK